MIANVVNGAGTDYASVTAESVAVTVDDDGTASSGVTLTASPDVVVEGANATTITITATLNGSTRDAATTVTVSVGSGTATSGTDFTAVDDFDITIPADTQSHTGAFSLAPIQDDIDEPNETVSVTGTTTIANFSVTADDVEITDDDDTPAVTLALSSAAVSESSGTATVTATLDRASSAATTVTISASPDSPATVADYSLSTNRTLMIAAGETTSTRAVTVTGVDNDVDTPDKTLQVEGAAENSQGVTGPADVTLTLEDDDTRGVALSTTTLEVDEGMDGTYTVVLDSEPTGNVIVTPARSSGDPDVTVSSGALTFTPANWSTAQTVTVSAADDANADDDSAVIANAVNGAGTDYASVTAESVTVTVDDDETASSGVTLTASPDVVGEGANATTITITATLNGSTRDVATTVTVSVGSGTATSGTDFTAVDDFDITIPADTQSQTATFSLAPIQDEVDEPNETVSVNGTTTASGLSVTGTELTITDDDAAPAVTLALSMAAVSESGGIATVTATLDRASIAATTVTISASPDSPATTADYSLSTNRTLMIAAGATTSTRVVTVTGVDNDVDTPDKTLQVEGAAENSQGVTDPADVTLTLEDDDTRGVTLSTTSLEVDEGRDGTYTVVLDSEPTGNVIVTPARSSGDPDVTVSSGALTFTPANWSTAQTVTVSAADDADADDDSAVIANAVNGGTTDYAPVTAESVTVTVDDDETPSSGVTLTASPDVVGEGANATSITITATLNGSTRSAATPVTVSVGSGTASSGTDFTAVDDFDITIPADTQSQTATFSLAPIQDEVDEPNETVSVNGTTTASGLSVTGTELTITDDDAAPAVTLALSMAAVSESGGIATVTATLDRASIAATIVTISASPDSPATTADYSLSTNRTLMIAAGATTSTRVVTVTGVDNDVDTPDKTLQVEGAAENSQGVTGPDDVTLTLEDDDTRGVTLSTTSLEVDEGMDGIYTVVLDSEPTGNVIVTSSHSSGDPDVTVSSGALTFTPANWSTAQTVTVSAGSDADAVDDSAVIANAVNGGATDYAPVTAESVTVTVDDSETASSGVTLAASPDVVVEGANATTVTVTATLNGGTRAAATTVTVSVGTGTATSGTDFMVVDDFDITIPADTLWQTGTFSLAPIQDEVDEPNETVSVTGATTIADFSVTADDVEITDDDAAPAVTLALSSAAVSESSGTATVTATLDRASSAATTVTISASPDSPTTAADYSLSTNRTLMIAAGATTSTRVVTVTGVDNDVDTPDKTLQVEGAAENTQGVTGPADVTLTLEDDDTRGVTLSTTTLEVDEGMDGTYTVVLASEPTGNVIVTPARSSGDPDVTVSSGALTFTPANWSTAQTVTVSAAVDANADDDSALIANAVNGAGTDYASVTAESVTVTVDDDGTASSGVTLTASPGAVAEGAGATSITVTAALNGDLRDSATPVTVSVGSGTAASGTDFTAVDDFTISIPSETRSHTGTFSLTPTQDDIDEENETIKVNGTTTVTDISVNGDEISITDDDSRGVTVSVTTLGINEDDEGTYTVVLDTQPTANVTVTPTRDTGDTDITVSGALTFTAANWNMAQTVTVSAADDPDAQDDTAVIAHTVGGGDYASVTAAAVTVTVDDNETASSGITLSVDPATVGEDSGETEITVTATLNGGTREAPTPVTVNVDSGTATAGVDFAAMSEFTVMIPAGADSASGGFTFTPIQDEITEDTETVSVNGATTVTGISVTGQELAITDDDGEATASLVLSAASISENGGVATVTAVLNRATSVATAIRVGVTPDAPAQTGDYSLSANRTLTIAAGATASTGEVTIAAVNNDIDAPDKTVQVEGEASNSLGVAGPADVELTLTDDDTRGVTVNPTDLELKENGSGSYAVVLNSQPTGSVTVNVTVPSQAQIEVAPTRLTFTADDWSAPQQVTVTRGTGSGAADISLSHSAAGGGYDDVPVPGVRVVLLQSKAEIEALELSLAANSRMLLNSVTGVFDGRRRALELPYSAIENESLSTQARAYLYGLARMASGSRRAGMPYAQTSSNLFGAGSSYYSTAMSTSGSMNAAGPIFAPASHGPLPDGMGGMTPGLMPAGGAILGAGTGGAIPGAGTGGGLNWESLLWGRSFVVPLGLTSDESAPAGALAGWTLWGASDLQDVSGAPDGGRYDGDMRSVYFGADREISRNWLAGIAISRAIGNINYQLTGADGTAAGSLGTRLTNLYPYVIGRLSEDLDVWALGGLGRGDADVDGERPDRWESGDLGMSLAAGGFRLGMAEYGAVRLAMIGDAGFTSLSTDGSGGVLDGLQASIRRLRLGMEGEVVLVSMRPYWQLSARKDSGDGQTGTGLDLVAGVRYSAPRVSFDAQGRWLLHSAMGYGEFSATATLAVSANPDGSGFILKLAPSWGQDAGGPAGMGGSAGIGGAMQLWGDRSLTMNPISSQSTQLSLAGEFGYGFLMRRGILTPLLSVSRNGASGQVYSLGVGYASLRELTNRQLNLLFTYGYDTDRPQDRVYGLRLIYLY